MFVGKNGKGEKTRELASETLVHVTNEKEINKINNVMLKERERKVNDVCAK